MPSQPGTAQRSPSLLQRLRRWLADRERDEFGVSTLFVVLFATAMLAVAGLVIDGGYVLGAKRAAMNQAEQAARIGADALDEAALRSGDTRVNAAQANAAAQAYLNHVGARGSVRVNGGEVTVTVTDRQDTTILSAVGVTSLPVRATATAVSIDEDSG
jgi:Flp pilus assembly protein TadG